MSKRRLSQFPQSAAAGLLLLVIAAASAQNQTVEQVAQTIAAQHNQSAHLVRDEMTVSSTATATGKNVRFDIIFRVRQGLPEAKRLEFDTENRKEIIPRVCAVKGNEVGFKRGMSYTFSSSNTYGEKLSEFTIDGKTCGIK